MPFATSWTLSSSTPSSSMCARIGRHRARRDSADVGVMAAGGDEEGRVARADRNTGITTVTSGRCVPPAYGAFSTYTSPGRIVSPRRRMISCTDSPIEPRCTGMCGAFAIRLPCVVEQRAREIEPLFDVDRRRGVRERHAHLLGDGHEQIVEHFQQHRVDARADGAGPLQRLHAPQDQVIQRRDFGAPAGLDHDRGVALADDRRARRSSPAAAARRDR